MLPQSIQMIMLSATIDSPEIFASWCERGNSIKQVCLCSTNERVVPLTHYLFLTTNESIFKVLKDKVLEKHIRETTNKLIMIQSDKGVFQEPAYFEVAKILKLFDQKHIFLKRKMVLNNLALFLRDRDMLPAIAFVFSRKNVEICAKEITTGLLEDDSKVPYIVRRECEQIIRKLPNFREYLELPEYNDMVALLEKGIGIHHSGMIPVLREIVELMISKKYIKLLFATESFAVGLDCPIKTAVFTGITKFDGKSERLLYSHEYTQMAGRAGRRGIDTIGNVVHLNNLFTQPAVQDYKMLLSGNPQKLVSKFHVYYSTVLNLIKNTGKADIEMFVDFVRKSMINREIAESITGTEREIFVTNQRIEKKDEFITLQSVPREVGMAYLDLEEKIKFAPNKKRKEMEREMAKYEDEYKNLKSFVLSLRELSDLHKEQIKHKSQLDYTKGFIEKEINGVCNILLKCGFIEKLESYQLTDLGKMSANIAEIHPLVLAKLIFMQWDSFSHFSAKQIVGLLSCFTDVKIPNDMRMLFPNTKDQFLKERIMELKKSYDYYENEEIEAHIHTGIQYDNALIFDVIDETMEWCDCDTEEKCKFFLQNRITEKSISVGDFTKCLLKIVVITKELKNIAENHVSMLYTLSQIEGLLMKYITTNQSLYV